MQNKFLRTLLIAAPFVLAIETTDAAAKDTPEAEIEDRCLSQTYGQNKHCQKSFDDCWLECWRDKSSGLCIEKCKWSKKHCLIGVQERFEACKKTQK